MLTIQQARALVGQNVQGIPAGFDGSSAAFGNLDPTLQVALNEALLDYIAANPDQFTPALVASAAADRSARPSASPGIVPLSAAEEFSTSDVADAALKAGDQVADVGRGVLKLTSSVGNGIGNAGKAVENATKTISYVLPLAIVAAIVIAGVMFYKGGAKGVAAGVAV